VLGLERVGIEATRLAPHDPGREPVAPEQMRLALTSQTAKPPA
jgi:hypothetical protein